MRRAAREMAEKAYKERLRQIEMSEFDGKLYESYSKQVRAQVKMLRVILENLQVSSTNPPLLQLHTCSTHRDVIVRRRRGRSASGCVIRLTEIWMR